MDISKVHCPDCDKAMKLTAATCTGCGLKLEGDFEVSALGRLSEEDQVFVVAFLRHHGWRGSKDDAPDFSVGRRGFATPNLDSAAGDPALAVLADGLGGLGAGMAAAPRLGALAARGTDPAGAAFRSIHGCGHNRWNAHPSTLRLIGGT